MATTASTALSSSLTPSTSSPAAQPPQAHVTTAENATDLYWLFFRRLTLYFTEVLPSLAALADDAHRVDHIVAKLSGGGGASLTAFTVPVYYAASQQQGRAAALFEILCTHAVRKRWETWRTQQKRLYGSTVNVPRPSRPGSATSSTAPHTTQRLGTGVLTPTRPSSASSAEAQLGARPGSHSSQLPSRPDSAEPLAVGRWSPHQHRRSQSRGTSPVLPPRSRPSSVASSHSSWAPPRIIGVDHEHNNNNGSTRSSCFTFSRSNNYVGGLGVDTEGCRPPRISSGSTGRSAGALVQPTAPPPSVAELVAALPQPAHVAQCGWCSGSHKTICGADAVVADDSGATNSGTTPCLITASQLLDVFTDYEPHIQTQTQTHTASATKEKLSWSFCPLCAAQLWMQRAWLCVRLLQRLDDVCAMHVFAAPFPLNRSSLSPSARELVLHRYHLARRLGLLGIEAGLGACGEVPLAAARDARLDGSGGVEAPLLVNTAEACAAAAQIQFNASLAASTLNTALGLLRDVAVLWPALTPTHHTMPGPQGDSDRDARLAQLRQWYSRTTDVTVVVRSGLLRAAVLLFVDLHGSAKALGLLSDLSESLDRTLMDLQPNVTTTTASEAADVDCSTSRGRVEAILARVSRWHDAWRGEKASLDSAKRQHRASAAASVSDDRRRSTAFESAEKALWQLAQLQHVLGMLAIFADLVGGRDALDNDDAGDGDEKNQDADDHHPHATSRVGRLTEQALPLLEARIAVFWTQARDEAADGGAATRARQSLALTLLLTAEVHRCVRSTQNSPARSGETEVRNTLKKLSQDAVRACGAAREFVSTTMAPTAPSDLLSAHDKLCWRFRPPHPQPSLAPQSAAGQKTMASCAVSDLAVVPVQWVRLWCLLCPVLFPSSCLTEFMQLHEEDASNDDADDNDGNQDGKAGKDADHITSEKQSAGLAPHTAKAPKCSSSAATAAVAASQSKAPRRPSRDGRQRSVSKPRTPASPPSLVRKHTAASAASKTATASKAAVCGTPQITNVDDIAARETCLRTLQHRLWYAPTQLSVCWRWYQLGQLTSPQSPGSSSITAHWCYATSCETIAPSPESSTPAQEEPVATPLALLMAALTAGHVVSPQQPSSSASLPPPPLPTLAALQEIFPEPFATALVALRKHAPTTSANSASQPNQQLPGGTTMETLRVDLEALYGPLSVNPDGAADGGVSVGGENSQGTHNNNNDNSSCEAQTTLTTPPVLVGLGAHTVVLLAPTIRVAVEAFADAVLPPLVVPPPPPPPRLSSSSAEDGGGGGDAVKQAAVEAAHTATRPLSQSGRRASSSSPSPDVPRQLPVMPMLAQPGRGRSPSSSPPQPDHVASSQKLSISSEDATHAATATATTASAVADLRTSRSGSLSASVPAMHMRVAGRLSRRPVLLMSVRSQGDAHAQNQGQTGSSTKPHD